MRIKVFTDDIYPLSLNVIELTQTPKWILSGCGDYMIFLYDMTKPLKEIISVVSNTHHTGRTEKLMNDNYGEYLELRP
jgi:hypothetical protein